MQPVTLQLYHGEQPTWRVPALAHGAWRAHIMPLDPPDTDRRAISHRSGLFTSARMPVAAALRALRALESLPPAPGDDAALRRATALAVVGALPLPLEIADWLAQARAVIAQAAA